MINVLHMSSSMSVEPPCHNTQKAVFFIGEKNNNQKQEHVTVFEAGQEDLEYVL